MADAPQLDEDELLKFAGEKQDLLRIVRVLIDTGLDEPAGTVADANPEVKTTIVTRQTSVKDRGSRHAKPTFQLPPEGFRG